MAFGVLDGGRGFVAAAAAALGVVILAKFLPVQAELATAGERRDGFVAIVLFYSAATAAVAVLAWLLVPAPIAARGKSGVGASLHGAVAVLQKPVVWAQAGIIIAAYCGYKGADNYSLYAVQVLGMNEVDGAKLAAYGAYVRPVAAVVAGFLADRLLASRVLVASFLVMAASCFMLFLAVPAGGWVIVIYTNLFVSLFAVFALRAIYFALVNETRTPPQLTGTTVGVVSFVGFTPEIFFAPITGRILDAAPGIAGHQNYFLFLAAVAAAGVVATSCLIAMNRGAPREAIA
jgi:nitrate/nitrite transporter NarK